jgi:hypothetical protein
LGGLFGWLVEATGAGLVGAVVGLVAIPAMSYCASPLWRRIKLIARGA